MGKKEYLDALKYATDLKNAWNDDKEYHKWLKRQYKKNRPYPAHRDKLSHSMRDGIEWQRFMADKDGEGWVLYGFVGFDPEDVALATDAEIDEWFRENMEIRIYSDYDCTGRSFTRWIDWHRNPDNSISYVHSVGIDV